MGYCSTPLVLDTSCFIEKRSDFTLFSLSSLSVNSLGTTHIVWHITSSCVLAEDAFNHALKVNDVCEALPAPYNGRLHSHFSVPMLFTWLGTPCQSVCFIRRLQLTKLVSVLGVSHCYLLASVHAHRTSQFHLW